MRRFPRNFQTRDDALNGPGHLFQHYRRDDLGRRDETARYNPATLDTSVVVLNATGLAESDIVAGTVSPNITFTVGGADTWVADLLTGADKLTALFAAFPAMDGIKAALNVDGSDFSLSADASTLTLVLPAVSGYSISADASYDLAFPKECFKNANATITKVGAITVTNGV